jgi:hypothetical protein
MKKRRKHDWSDGMWLDRYLFESPFYLGLFLTEQQLNSAMRRMKIPAREWPSFPKTGATVNYLENKINASANPVAIVSISNKHQERSLESVLALIVHECMHIWRAIKKNIGEKKSSSEFEAYAMQSLTQAYFGSYLLMKGKNKPNKCR